jgi:predicted phage replisome organizer
MADVKWIKIVTDIFDDEKILLVESLPDSDSMIVIWFKLLTLAGKQNNNGVFLMSNRIPYTDEMLATIFRRNINTVRLALRTFEQFGMIEIVDNVITIPNWNKHQSLDAYEKRKARDRLYQQERRAAQKALIAEKSSDTSSDASSDVVVSEGEEDKEEDKKEKKKIDYQLIADMYNSICTSFPSIRSLSDARKKAINARLKTYSVDDFKTVFENAEASSFLKGGNNRNWTASFDWLMKDANMAKVLDGNYSDKKRNTNGYQSPARQINRDDYDNGDQVPW